MTTETEMMRLLERADPVRGDNAAPMADAAQYLEQLIASDRVVPVADLTPVEDTSTDESVADTQPSPKKDGVRRRRLLAAAAVAAAIAVIASIAVEERGGNDGVSTVPPVPNTDTTHPAPTTTTMSIPMVAPAELLPAEGTAVSTPETGDLVAVAAHIHRGGYYLYADGRLITISDKDYGVHSWVERRLSPEGIEAVRQVFLATGMFEPGDSVIEVTAGIPPRIPGCDVCDLALVRDDDGRLLARTDLGGSLEPDAVTPALEQALSYIEELDATIPQDWWVDREIKDYVPAKYSIDFTRWTDADTSEALDANAGRALLPTPAAELLAGQEIRTIAGPSVLSAGDGAPAYSPSVGNSPSSFVVPPDVARTLVEQFPDALTPAWLGPADGVGWTIADNEPEPMFLTLTVWGMLPHGALALWGG